jgi:hypothetical protein
MIRQDLSASNRRQNSHVDIGKAASSSRLTGLFYCEEFVGHCRPQSAKNERKIFARMKIPVPK